MYRERWRTTSMYTKDSLQVVRCAHKNYLDMNRGRGIISMLEILLRMGLNSAVHFIIQIWCDRPAQLLARTCAG